MYCPNCAKAASADQKYCRSCGFNLERTADSLIEQLSGDPALDLRGREEALERFGNVVFTGFGIVIAIGIGALIYAVLSRMVFSGTQPLAGIILALVLLFAAPSLAYVFWRESLKAKRANLIPSQLAELDKTATVPQLCDASRFESVQSVVESTTELLPADNKTREFDRHSGDRSI